MRKIAIFQKNFQVGGIQRTLLNILSQLDTKKYAVDVFYFDPAPFYQLPERDNLNFILCRPYPYISGSYILLC